MVRRTSVAEARAELASLVESVAHDGDRVVLTSRGRPRAALVGLDDLAAIEDLPTSATSIESTLLEADRLVERIRLRRNGVFVSNSADDLAAKGNSWGVDQHRGTGSVADSPQSRNPDSAPERPL